MNALKARLCVTSLVAVLLTGAGCESTPRQQAKYPPGALPVRYESAASYSSCLVTSVAMAANYLVDDTRFGENSMRSELKLMGLDETRVGDLKAYLQTKGLHLVTLSGKAGDKPPTGLGYWLKSRRYPVICVINGDASGNPDFNHAVVVIGISEDSAGESADIIHYFDPSWEAKPLQSTPQAAFEQVWARGNHGMMVVVAPPGGSGMAGGAGPKEMP